MKIVLIAGLWLDERAWDEVVPPLRAAGHDVAAVALPGQGDGRTDATLADQVAAVRAAVDAAGPDPVVLVGHSAAATLAWLAVDARPESVAKVVFVGGWPAADGERYADLFEPVDGLMRFPGWKPFEGPDADDLDAATRERIERGAHAVPVGVSRAEVHLHDERRLAVPAVLVCPEFSPEQAREWLEAGHLGELARIRDLELVDIDSGHWPMFSRPQALAELLDATATA
ncbi:alpha/beta fold hydrolase [Nocardioides sp.]|uniref:alpha/beta fold hydrolase n=1 Tax=Nocardioides sp. TaxID=35761 RepID=UPI00378355CA